MAPARFVLRGPRPGFPRHYTRITRADVTSENTGEQTGMEFGIQRLDANTVFQGSSPLESAWVLLRGTAELEFEGRRAPVARESLFDEPPTALHVARHAKVVIHSQSETEWAVVKTANERDFPSRLFLPSEVKPEYRGAGLVQSACLRNVRLIFDRATRPESNLVLGEVVNYAGRWSSYPPHHHVQPEIYHYRFTAPAGYGHAELGDDVVKVRDGDTVVIPPGRDHAQVAAPGYGMYYLWMIRHLPDNPYTGFTFAPEHAWALDPARQGWRPSESPLWPRMKNTVTLNMAAALVKFLQQQYVSRDGVEHRLINGVFGIFGHGNVTGFGQALEEHGGRSLPYFQPKTEQAMVHTAIAYAKARQRLGTFACTSSIGPGATNMLTGAATATINRLPVLLLPGDIFANRIPGPVLQQLEYPGSQDVSVNDCFRPVSKYWDRINRPEQILTALPEAMRVLSDPAETGAVTLALPEDVQAESYAYPAQFFDKRVYAIERPEAPAASIETAAAWIRAARRPLIVAGGGVHYSNATEALAKLGTSTGIPIAVTQAGKGAVVDAHPSCLGALGVTGTAAANAIALDADLVLCIGTRLSDFTTASKTQFQNPRVRFIGLNIHPADARKHGALPLVGDAQAVLHQLTAVLAGWRIAPAFRTGIQRAREAWDRARIALVAPKRGVALTQAQVIDEVNRACGAEGIMVHSAGGLPGDLHKLWRSHAVDDYHSEYGYSCMGYEIAGAMGVKLARPSRQVIAFVGDGSYLMLHTEIVTAVQEGVTLTIVLVDNHGYGCIHGLQRGCGGNSFGNEFRLRTAKTARLEGNVAPVDFVKNAESLGATAVRAHTPAELRAALADSKQADGVRLIYVQVPADVRLPGYSWWDVPVSGTSKVPGVRKARAAYEQAAKKQRYYY